MDTELATRIAPIKLDENHPLAACANHFKSRPEVQCIKDVLLDNAISHLTLVTPTTIYAMALCITASTHLPKHAQQDIYYVDHSTQTLPPKTATVLINAATFEEIATSLKDHAGKIILHADMPPDDMKALSIIAQIQDSDQQILLNSAKNDIEINTGIIISEQCAQQALMLVSRYCAKTLRFDYALRVLTFAAKRKALSIETQDSTDTALSLSDMTSVIADWEQLPQENLAFIAEDIQHFEAYLNSHVVGQNDAIHLIAKTLQTTYISPQFRSHANVFIFAGPDNVGKMKTAEMIATYLNGDKKFLLRCDLSDHNQCQHISDIRLPSPRSDRSPMTLIEMVAQYPKIVITIESISENKVLFEKICAPLFNEKAAPIFDEALFIISLDTKSATNKITTIPTTTSSDVDTELLHLLSQAPKQMHLIDLPDKKSCDELIHDFMPQLTEYLPEKLLSQATIIPFSTIDNEAVITIVKNRFEIFKKTFSSTYKIKIDGKPEIFAYLAKKLIDSDHDIHYADRLIESTLMPCLSRYLNTPLHARLGQTLMLFLNDTGETIKAHYV